MSRSVFILIAAVISAAALAPIGLGLGGAAPRDHTPPSRPTVDGDQQTGDLTPAFHFAAKDDRTPATQIRFRCAIDSTILRPCSHITRAPAPLSFGPHLLRVRALDRAGNASKVAAYAFTVTGIWNAGPEFVKSPNAANPSRDMYGNTTWFYLYSGTVRHDPVDYHVLPYFTLIDAGTQEWHSTPETYGIPGVWVGGAWGQISMRPGTPTTGQDAILGWRSPLTGRVTVDATIRSNETWCTDEHNGLRWSIDQGAATLQSGHLALGETATITALSTAVTTGEALYVVIDAEGNSNCDNTLVDFGVETG
jgi:hypothetical protein